VTFQTDRSYTLEEEYAGADEESKRGLTFWILIVSIVIGIGCGSALAWRWSFGLGPLVSTTPTDKPGWSDDLAALRQEMTQTAQASQQLLAAQQAEIKRLSGQVLELTSKLELIPSATPVGASVDTPPWQGDLAALRREMMQSAQTSHQLRAAQDAEFGQLSRQVAALSSKLELLHPMTSAHAAMPGPTPEAADAPAPAAVRKSAIPLPKKRPEVPNAIVAEPGDTQASQPAPTEPLTPGSKLKPRLWL
jgi:hypothetical protein